MLEAQCTGVLDCGQIPSGPFSSGEQQDIEYTEENDHQAFVMRVRVTLNHPDDVQDHDHSAYLRSAGSLLPRLPPRQRRESRG